MARKHKIKKALTHLVQAIIRFAQKLTSRNTYRFLRTAFVTSRRRLQAGFVLPTTMLLIIVMMLVVSTLIFRSYQRSVDVIGQFQQQQVRNAATPAVERAKAKLENLFSDKPGGVYTQTAGIPPETTLEAILADPNNDSYYTFKGEERLPLVLPGNTPVQTAWSFQTDTDGDGKIGGLGDTTTAYAIVLRSSRAVGGGLKTMDPRLAEADPSLYTFLNSDKDKADYFVVRNGPIFNTEADAVSCKPRFEAEEGGASNEFVQGWFQVGGSDALLMKNFQVYAVSIPNSVLAGNAVNPVISTVQYQQDRDFQRANKWGAWFRTDIEINPGVSFDWNGAIHSEGSLFISGQQSFLGKLISTKESCFFHPKSNSDITLGGHLVNSLLSRNATLGGSVNLEIYESPPPTPPKPVNINTDSTALSGFNLSLKPKSILLYNKSEAINADLQASLAPQWENGEIKDRRVEVLLNAQAPPYIDDTYRADDRYGPKPGYGKAEPDADGNLTVRPICDMGEEISGCPIAGAWNLTGPDDLTREEPRDPILEPDSYGLDGYWERRARGQGLRVMVGQRLELGNAFGWKNADDPLYPLATDAPTRKNEMRQRRTQRDNLAAVQSTLVYHKDDKGSNGYEPAAVVATTVHPGTEHTLRNSATFETIKFGKKPDAAFNALGTTNTTGIIGVDFFNGYGTNGWEFEAPDVTKTEVKIALNNLANFAGDSNGEYPRTNPDKVSPPPALTMWGNFSNLSRALPDESSLADKTTKQTAAATLGMLAYNINYLQSYNYAEADNQSKALDGTASNGLNALADALYELQDGTYNLASKNYEVMELDPSTGSLLSKGLVTNVGGQPVAGDYALPPEAYITALEKKRDSYTPTTNADYLKMDRLVKLARLVMSKEQVGRDRTYGFQVSASKDPANNAITFKPNIAPALDPKGIWETSGPEVNIACNVTQQPPSGNSFFGLDDSFPDIEADADKTRRLLGLSRLCSNQPKFPSLYYIFPTADHKRDGNGTQPDPGDEPYPYILPNVDYKALTDDAISKIAIQPRKLADWVLPYQSNGFTPTNAALAAPNDSRQELIKFDGTNHKVAIKDSALFDGREEMSVRVLNLDMDMLRSKKTPGDKETWLPYSGIVYAFREDAVREDAIVQPGDPALEVDPVTGKGKMSIKSVDGYADPDRRPHGFRLKNGQDLRRKPGGNVVTSILRGLTLVSDNPVYIQGDFNLHTSNGTDELIEIVSGNVNPSFAEPTKDYWRPTEILGDAITIISDNFCDGSIEDGLFNRANTAISIANQTKYGCQVNNTQNSYINQNRPKDALLPTTTPPSTFWQRENPYEDPDPDKKPKSPILISRNAQPMTVNITTKAVTPYSGTYYSLADDRTIAFAQANISKAKDTKVNIVMINGVVPPRENQGNGGLINFPRMLEDWNSAPQRTLSIRGSFMQLNFSNYATAPFDRDAWEPTQTPSATDRFFHYLAPKRNWGYDVGLQYLPAGPVLRRMVIPGTQRSEFYREPRADDPYICKLRDAIGFKCTD